MAQKNAKTVKRDGVVEARCVDGSTFKLTLLDERLELVTAYGKLVIPVADIVRIELAWRTPEAVARRIDQAVADLGNPEYKRRQAASDRERGNPQARAARGADPHRRRRGLPL